MLSMQLMQQTPGFPKSPHVEITFNDEDGVILSDAPAFDISTFRKATRHAATIGSICDLNNKFFHSLPLKNQKALYEYFVQMKTRLGGVTRSTLQESVRGMADLTEKVFLDLKIPDRLLEFVEHIGLEFPSLAGKGSRIQDTDKKTFTRDEYPQVTAVSLLCKILCPIIGQAIQVFQPPVCGKEDKELFTFDLFEPVLSAPHSKFHPIYSKLRFFLEDTIRTELEKMKKNPNNRNSTHTFAMADRGFCEKHFRDLVCAIIMAKKLASFDLFESDSPDKIPNIVTYVWVVVSETAVSKMSTIQGAANKMPRFEPSSVGSGEDNTTLLENTARISKDAFDLGSMVEVGVEIMMPRILKDFDIDQGLFDAGMKWYGKNMIMPSPFNRALIASLLESYIGGSPMLLRLHMTYYAMLLVVTQQTLIKRGFWDLAVLLSCHTPVTAEPAPISTTAQRIMSSYDKTIEFSEAKKLCPGFSEKIIVGRSERGRKTQTTEHISLESQLQRLMGWCIEYPHFYNMPTAYWKQCPVEYENRPAQGSRISLVENIMRDVCSFFVQCHGTHETDEQDS